MRAQTIALLIGLVFIAVGLLGFIENPIVGDGEDVIFHADTVHNMVHIVSGIFFFVFAMAGYKAARNFIVLFGILYLLIGILGMLQIGDKGMTEVLGFLHVNPADNFLHIGLGILITLLGFAAHKPVAGS